MVGKGESRPYALSTAAHIFDSYQPHGFLSPYTDRAPSTD